MLPMDVIDKPRWRNGDAPGSPLAILVGTLPVGPNSPPALMRTKSSSMDKRLLLAGVAGPAVLDLFFPVARAGDDKGKSYKRKRALSDRNGGVTCF